MNQFEKCVKIYFEFLNQFGYIIAQENAPNIIRFEGVHNQIYISFSETEYELACQFVDFENRDFSLQDGLNYESIKAFKGLYQISSKDKIEDGISYLATAVKTLFERIDISDYLNFQKIYQFRLDAHKELLQDYYLETDLKKAEYYWEKKEYAKVAELLQRHISHLTRAQRKKLEYANNHKS